MNENGKFALLVAGVGVGAFVACAGVALVLKLVASPTVTVTEVGPLTTEVAPAFNRVRVEDIKPGDNQRSTINNAGGMLRLAGVHVADELIAAAYDDAPHAVGYTAYAQLDHAGDDSDATRESGVPRGLKVACAAMRMPAPETPPAPADEAPTTRHGIVRYDATRMTGGGSEDDVSLERWIESGCAQAVRDGGRVLSKPALAATLLELIPQTPEFVEQRRFMHQHMADLR